MSNLPRRNMGRTGMQPRALGMGAAFVGAAGETGNHRHHRTRSRSRHRLLRQLCWPQRGSLGQGASRRRAVELLHAGQGWPAPGASQGLFRGGHALERRTKPQFASRRLPRRRVSPRPARYCRPVRPCRAFDELQKMKEEGLVRHIGLGVREHEFHRAAIEAGHAEIVLTFLDYTLLDQSVLAPPCRLAKARHRPDLSQRLRHGALDRHRTRPRCRAACSRHVGVVPRAGRGHQAFWPCSSVSTHPSTASS